MLDIPFLTPGQASANPANAANLGKTVVSNGKVYVLAKAGAAIAAAAKKGVVTAFSAGVPTWAVDVPADPQGYAFGIIPAGQVGSDGSTGLLSGDYFLLQVSGAATGLSGMTLIKTTGLQPGLAVNSLGRVFAYAKITSITVSLVQQLNNTSFITNTAVASAGDDITCVLSGLL